MNFLQLPIQTAPKTDLDYKTLEERLAEARKHEQPYSVWNYKTGEKELTSDQ